MLRIHILVAPIFPVDAADDDPLRPEQVQEAGRNKKLLGDVGCK